MSSDNIKTVTALPKILMGDPPREVDWKVLYRKQLDATNRERHERLFRVKEALDRGDEFAGRQALTSWEQLPGPKPFAAVMINNADGSVVETTFSNLTLEQQRGTLAAIMTREIRGVRLVVFNKHGRLTPGIWCPDVTSALYVRAALGGKTHICAKCGEIYTPNRSDQIYCGLKCENAMRAARYRANKRGKKR